MKINTVNNMNTTIIIYLKSKYKHKIEIVLTKEQLKLLQVNLESQTNFLSINDQLFFNKSEILFIEVVQKGE